MNKYSYDKMSDKSKKFENGINSAKEAYWFGVPCITLREETEWVELLKAGCNQVVGTDGSKILAAVVRAESAAESESAGNAAELYGDGHSSDKIVSILVNYLRS